jgi:hypothetical protein
MQWLLSQCMNSSIRLNGDAGLAVKPREHHPAGAAMNSTLNKRGWQSGCSPPVPEGRIFHARKALEFLITVLKFGDPLSLISAAASAWYLTDFTMKYSA